MLIYNKKINEKEIIEDITKKPSLKNIEKSFLKRKIKENLTKDKKTLGFLSKEHSKRSKTYKDFIKEIRRQANLAHGMFQKKGKNILETHSSTKERLKDYPYIYKQIFKTTKKPNSIIDLGCGLNPFSLKYTNLKNITYYAYDLDTSLIKKHLKNVKAKNLDLQIEKNILKLPKADLCLMFKFLDSLEKPKKYTEFIIKNLKVKFLVISFPLKTLKNKKMTTQKRGWLEQMLKRLKYTHKTFKTDNEIFYIIKNTSQ